MEDDLRTTTQIKQEDTGEDRHGSEQEVMQDEKQFELSKAQIGEVREENQRLRVQLEQMMKEYQTLEQKFQDIIQQQEAASTSELNTANNEPQIVNDETVLVSLSLGRTTSTSDLSKKLDKRCSTPPTKIAQGLGLGLECGKFEVSSTTHEAVNQTPDNYSMEEAKGGETPKRSGDDPEVSQQNPAKKTRVSVRVRCDTPTMNDGCQWRKYGQKIAKGNPCPRAYYRCTVSTTCPVRKQVQRCPQDMSILVTTYEGTHNHPLPVSATAMASTTSAAASMSTSGSNSSHGLNFYLNDINSKLEPIYLQPPHSSISSSPTVTLDLTSNTPLSTSSPNRSSQVAPPRYSTTNLNFSSLDSNALPISWSLNYAKNQMGSLNFGTTQPQENIYHSNFIQNKNMMMATPTTNQQKDSTIEAATRVITSDPNFQSALKAALTSIIIGGGAVGNQGAGDDKSSQTVKLEDTFPVFSFDVKHE